MSISYVRAHGKDISEVVDEIETAVEGRPTTHVTIACLVVAITAQKPDIQAEELQNTIKGVSEWLAACLQDTSTGSVN